MSFLPQLPVLAALCWVIIAAAQALRSRKTESEWALIGGALLVALEALLSWLSLQADSSEAAVHWQEWRLTVAGLIPGAWLVFGVTYSVGNARHMLRRAAWTIAPCVLIPVILTTAARTQLLVDGSSRAPSLLVQFGTGGILLHVTTLIGAVLVLMNLERTFRAAIGTIRWRLKFVLLGVGALFLVRIYTTSQGLMFRGTAPTLEIINALGTILAALVVFRGLLRSWQFKSDVYPSLSLLQGSLTITLAGAYLLIVGILGNIAARLGGDASLTFKAFLVMIAMITLAVVLQSDRARLFLRRFLIRHFQRPAYDYREIWRKFSERTGTCVEQQDLCRASVRAIAEIFEALAVSLWLVNDRRDGFTLGDSTSLSEAQAAELAPTSEETRLLLNQLERDADAVDIELTEADWAAILRRCHPSQFLNGGNRLCVPLLRQRRLVGFIVLGDRISGVAFPLHDFDLLKCIADHVSASLLNMQMSRQLLQAKEFEAFQTMATFFVHDLKNAASTLNLTLKNLPIHYDNPEFRADALRAISKTVTHINRLTGRLSALRHELKIEPAECDLNDVVRAALSDLAATASKIVTDLAPLPRTQLDPDQLQKVITNLVLNATEAIGKNGTVRVTTSQDGGWLSVAVSDDGCGMTEEFMRNSLFRPFQTTKPQGLGIGMFQSRMIIEAHGGRIQVTSKVGNGTTFRLYFPVVAAADRTSIAGNRSPLLTNTPTLR